MKTLLITKDSIRTFEGHVKSPLKIPIDNYQSAYLLHITEDNQVKEEIFYNFLKYTMTQKTGDDISYKGKDFIDWYQLHIRIHSVEEDYIKERTGR